MKYRFFTKSDKAWLAMLEDIKSAKKSIYLESFILTDDALTHSFFEILKTKATEGVKIKIVVDQTGNFWWGSLDKTGLERAGAEVLFFNRWFHHSHRKILIIDGQIAYIGGVNISGQFAKWLDLHLRLTGALLQNLSRSFSRIYELAGGKDEEILRLRRNRKVFKARHALYKAKSWLIEHWPIKGRYQLKAYYKKKCHEAKKSIVIATPYFIPHGWLIKSLTAAAARGVRIEVIVPKDTDNWFVNLAHRVFGRQLGNKMNFLFIPEMNHAKVLLVDDSEGLIGSNNIDALSFNFNLEASVVFQRKDMVGDLKKILERWKKSALPLDKIDPYNHWYHKILGVLIRILQPIL